MECGTSWDSTTPEDHCHVCGMPDIAVEVEEEKEDETRESD
jgi:hypothetical protein